MGTDEHFEAAYSINLATRLAAEFGTVATSRPVRVEDATSSGQLSLTPLQQFDLQIIDANLRLATRSRYATEHYADAVESGVKALNELVRDRTGSMLDGDALMTWAFSPTSPKLRLSRLRSDSDRSQQRGHMMMCQGVVAAWRNPRAHSSGVIDSPKDALEMLGHLQHLMLVTKGAIRTRSRVKTKADR